MWTEALHPVGKILFTPRIEASYYPLKLGTNWRYRIETSDGEQGQLTQQIVKIEKIDGQDLARLEVIVNGEVVASEHLRSSAAGESGPAKAGATLIRPVAANDSGQSPGPYPAPRST